jgi:hypothetical protein
MKTPDFNLRLVDAVAHGVYRYASELSDAEVVAKLDEIQRTFLAEGGVSAEQAIEATRAVSGFKFKLLSQRDLPEIEVRRLYEEKARLGFSHLLDEGTVGIYFAQYCLRVGAHEAARAVLVRLLEKANDISAGPPTVRSQLRRDVNRTLGLIQS